MKNTIENKIIYILVLAICINGTLSAQCFDDANITCPNPLIATVGDFCSGPNPPTIRNALGWGINYNPANDSFEYTDHGGILQRRASSYGLIRTIHVQVNSGGQTIYLAKRYYFNITIQGRNQRQGNYCNRSNFPNSCWSTKGSCKSFWLRQQRAFARGQVPYGNLHWVAASKSNPKTLSDMSDYAKSSVADRAKRRLLVREGENCPLNIPVAGVLPAFTTTMRPVFSSGSLCIDFDCPVPAGANGTLFARKVSGAARIIWNGPVVPAGANTFQVDYDLNSGEYLDWVDNTPCGHEFFNEWPERLSANRAADQGKPNLRRSPDNICLIADNDGDGIWDDQPQAGIDF